MEDDRCEHCKTDFDSVAYTAIYLGTKYYFCSFECRRVWVNQKFELYQEERHGTRVRCL